MTKYVRPSLLASILAGVVCGIGCSPLTFVSFLGPEPQIPPEMHLFQAKDKKAAVNVVILTYTNPETREEFLAADRQLSDLLRKQLVELAKVNTHNLTFVNMRKVDEYKATHPHWQEDVGEVGRDLKADYVIYLEINSLSMYEKDSSHQLYHGRAEITISLHKVGDDDGVPEQKHYHGVYPTVTGAIPVDADKTPTDFREEFLSYVAKHIAWYFEGHPATDRYLDNSGTD